MNTTAKVQLLVNHQDLENDDRFAYFVNTINGNQMTLNEIATNANVPVNTVIDTATLLFNEGFLEVIVEIL